MRYEHVTDPAALRERERAQAQAAKNAANIDYIAMMADVDIPTEEQEGIDDESEI